MNEVPLLVASRNEGKLRELRLLFASLDVALVDLRDAGIAESPVEDELEKFETFEANALAKARHFHALTGLPTVADDSGLSVVALDGAPGVRSKRFSGASGTAHEVDAANNAYLISRMSTFDARDASFVCAAAFVGPSVALVHRAEVGGAILRSPQGTGGFGYDAYFNSTELGKTFAEATIAEKQSISHRGRAFTALVRDLMTRGVIGACR